MTNVTTSGNIWSEEDMSMPEAPHVLLKGYRRLQLQRLMSFYGFEFNAEETTGEMMRDQLLKSGVKIPKFEEFHDMIQSRKVEKDPVEVVVEKVEEVVEEVEVEEVVEERPILAKKQVKRRKKRKG